MNQTQPTQMLHTFTIYTEYIVLAQPHTVQPQPVVCNVCYIYMIWHRTVCDTKHEPPQRSLSLADSPDLFVDGVQLLLQHHGQGLSVRVAARRQQVHGAEEGLAVVVVDVRHLRVALERVAAQDAQLLGTPLLLAERLRLTMERAKGQRGA